MNLHCVWICFPGGSAGKESACNVGNLNLIPGLERSLGEGKGYPLQYSGLENSMDHIVHGVSKSWTWLRDFHFWLIQECEAYPETGLLKSSHISVMRQSPTYEPSSCELSKPWTRVWSQQGEPVPLASSVSEIAAHPPGPIADAPSALPFPTSLPSSSQ